MKILDYSTKGATIQFDQNELLLVMALLEKGTDIYGSQNNISKEIDRQFLLANLLVEDKRRKAIKTNDFRNTFVALGTVRLVPHVLASND